MKNFPVSIKSFNEIKAEYEFVNKKIEIKTLYYNKLISKGYQVPSAGKYYKFNTLKEANELRTKLINEIERKYTLEITASFEAKLVYYFKNIIKRNNPMYKALPQAAKRGNSYLMFNDFIVVFKTQIQPLNNIVYANFVNLVDFRNWLAHGRGWDLERHLQKFDFEYTNETIFELINYMPNFPDELKE